MGQILVILGLILVVASIVLCVMNSSMSNFFKPEFSNPGGVDVFTLGKFIFLYGLVITIYMFIFPVGYHEVFGGMRYWYVLGMWVFVGFLTALCYMDIEKEFGKLFYYSYLTGCLLITAYVLIGVPACQYSPNRIAQVKMVVTRITAPVKDSVSNNFSSTIRIDGDSTRIDFGGSGGSGIDHTIIRDDCGKIYTHYRGDNTPQLEYCNGEKPQIQFQSAGSSPEKIIVTQTYVIKRKNLSTVMAEWVKSFF